MSKRVLIISDCPTLNTGYARVSRLIASSLHTAGYHVKYLPCNATLSESDKEFDYDVDNFDYNDRYFNRRIGDVLTKYKPSLTIVVGEFIYLGYIGSVCRSLNLKSLYYIPVEGENYPPHFVYYQGGHIDYKLTIAKFHYIVAYSEFGKNQVHKQLPGIVHTVIPHGVNANVFRPLDKLECRKKFFPNLVNNSEIGNDKFFVVGAVYRNQRRKGVDYLLKGFKHFVKNYEKDRKCFLFLVMDPKDHQGYNINNYTNYLGINGRVLNVPVIGGKEGPSDDALAEIYNTFDVHCCPFRAEGWGLPIIEGMASGVHTLITDYSTPPEYAGDAVTKIPVFDTEPIVSTNCEWAVLDYKEVGNALGRVYDNVKTEFHNMKAVETVSKYSEEKVGKMWVDLVNSLDIPEMPEIEENPNIDGRGMQGSDDLISNYIDALES